MFSGGLLITWAAFIVKGLAGVRGSIQIHFSLIVSKRWTCMCTVRVEKRTVSQARCAGRSLLRDVWICQESLQLPQPFKQHSISSSAATRKEFHICYLALKDYEGFLCDCRAQRAYSALEWRKNSWSAVQRPEVKKPEVLKRAQAFTEDCMSMSIKSWDDSEKAAFCGCLGIHCVGNRNSVEVRANIFLAAEESKHSFCCCCCFSPTVSGFSITRILHV